MSLADLPWAKASGSFKLVVLSQSHDDHHWAIEEQRTLDSSSDETFDCIAFAMRALALLRPPLTVTVYPRSRQLSMERGRDLRVDPAGTWALLGIPADASRAHIALAVADLAPEAHRAWLLDLLVNGG